MAQPHRPNEIRLIRIFEAPPETIWAAWTDPAQVGQWWGPRGFTLTTDSREVRPGGHWRYTMHGPDGTDYPNYATYLEVEAPRRLVYDHGATSADAAPLFRVTVTFRALDGGRTEMDMTMALATPEAAAHTRAFIRQAGGESTWDRLAEHVTTTPGRDPFVINRSFAAPLATLRAMWTEPEHLVRWLAPTGSTMRFLRPTIAEGASSFYTMTDANGVSLWGRAHYLELSPTRLVYTQQFVDEHENLSRHPFAPTWPETMLTTVTFTEEGPNETRVTVTWEVYGDATADERAMFHGAKAGMTGGWTGSFDKLEAVIAAG